MRGSQSRSYWEKDLVILAELRPSMSSGLSSQQIVPREHVNQNIRTQTDPFLPYIIGSVGIIHAGRSSDPRDEIESTIEINFNEHNLAWHYGWKSNKHVSDHKHVVDVVILVQGKNELANFLIPIGSFLSEEFLVTSTRAVKELSKRTQELNNIDVIDGKRQDEISIDISVTSTNSSIRPVKKNSESRSCVKKRAEVKTKNTEILNDGKVDKGGTVGDDDGDDDGGSNSSIDNDMPTNVAFI